MKVKVRRVPAKMATFNALLKSPAGKRAMLKVWPVVASELETSTLEQMLQMHANDELPGVSIDVVLVLLDELAQRRIGGYDPIIPHKLTPSPAGRECLGNGHWPGYACQCPGCDFYEQCFPDWEGRKSAE